MNAIKKYFGLIWLLLAPLVIFELINGAIQHIDTAGKKDINNPVIWIIIIAIFTPIAIGLVIFGWYAFRGNMTNFPRSLKTCIPTIKKFYNFLNISYLRLLLCETNFAVANEKDRLHITGNFQPGSGRSCHCFTH